MPTTPKLSVNVNKIATLRNARGGQAPDLMHFVSKIVGAGGQAITAHPRTDRRHITPSDIAAIHQWITQHNKSAINAAETTIEMNWEGDLREEFLELVESYPPSQCTLVPVSFGELTSHRGFKVKSCEYLLTAIIAHLKSLGVRSSVFVEAGDFDSIERLAKIGCDRIEIYTEPYARSFTSSSGSIASLNYEKELKTIISTACFSHDLGLGVNAGHDLTHQNIPPLVARVPHLAEISVGHHLISYALEVGIEAAMAHYLAASQTSQASS